MKIYEFPKDPQKRKAEKSLERRATENKKPLNPPPLPEDGIYSESEEYSEDIDVTKINRILFFRYIRWFPSFKPFKGLIQKNNLETLFEYYCNESIFTEPQEIIFEFLVELLSPYDCGFMIKEMYLFLSSEDREALIRILSDFSHFVR